VPNDNYVDPNNVPGTEGADEELLGYSTNDDPAAGGVDDDGTSEALGIDPLDPSSRPLDQPELDVPSGLMREIPDPTDEDGTSDPA
jgi:hypothetical protein